MVELSFVQISERLANTTFPDVDLIVGIATGGTVIAAIIAHQLAKPLHLIKVNFRNADNTLKYDLPQLLSDSSLLHLQNKKILLVDDVSVSGSTLSFVKKIIHTNEVVTFILKGKNADIVLFPEIGECVKWPWHV